MEKILKTGVIISICALAILCIYNIYDDIILAKMYNNTSSGTLVREDDKTYELCNNMLVKYITGIKQDNRNIKKFISSVNTSNSKNKIYIGYLNNFETARMTNVYRINDNTYMVEYSLFHSDEKMYKIVFKVYEKRNYFKVLYDELYENGRGE